MTQYLRVMPHERVGSLHVPIGGGRKIGRDDAPKEGHLVMDSHFIRRRLHFGELVLLAEGPAALLEAAPEAAAAKPAAQPVAAALVANAGAKA